MGRKRQDLQYRRFGHLKVVSLAYTTGSVGFWNCVCDCGRQTVISACNLRGGSTTSCGCRKNAPHIEKDLPLFNQKVCSTCGQQNLKSDYLYGNHSCRACINKRKRLRNEKVRRENGIRPRKYVEVRYPVGPLYVYLVRITGTNRYKIGKSLTPDRRFRELQQERPWEHIQPLVAMRVNDEEWPYDEPHMHKLFADYCIVPGREWFEFDDDKQILMAFLNGWRYESCEDFSSKKRAALETAAPRRTSLWRTSEKLAGLKRSKMDENSLISVADTLANEIAYVATEWPDVIE